MSRLKKLLLLVGDVAILYVSLVATILLRYPLYDFKTRFSGHLLPFSIIFILWLLIFYIADLYQSQSLRNKDVIVQSLVWGVLLSGIASAVTFYLFGGFFSLAPKTNLAIFGAVFIILDYAWRILSVKLFSSGAWGIGILGDSPLIDKIISHLKEHPHTGYKTVFSRKEISDEDFAEIKDLVLKNKIQFLIVQTKLVKDPRTLNGIYHLIPLQTNVISLTDFYELLFGKVPVDELEERWFIEKITTRRKAYDAFKGVLDVVFAVISGIIFLPFAVLIALIIKITSRGPVIYKQDRMGKNGKIFRLYKFRTMENGDDGPLWTEKDDHRITAFGKFLRFTHLDELPQLWNILKGDISVTGPRPERTELAEQYQKLPYYEIRHVVKPGLTGWAQTNFRPSASMEEAKEKLEYDIYYVKNRSFLLDMLIILRTLRYIFTGSK